MGISLRLWRRSWSQYFKIHNPFFILAPMLSRQFQQQENKLHSFAIADSRCGLLCLLCSVPTTSYKNARFTISTPARFSRIFMRSPRTIAKLESKLPVHNICYFVRVGWLIRILNLCVFFRSARMNFRILIWCVSNVAWFAGSITTLDQVSIQAEIWDF